MNKNLLYSTVALITGLFLGYILFGTSSDQHVETKPFNVSEKQFWTCTMHPQIRQLESGDCPICAMNLVAVSSGNEDLAFDEIRMTKNAMALANIQTHVIENGMDKQTAVDAITLSGKIIENADKTATIPAHFDGRVEQLFITSIGQKVHKGQLIATVYAPTLLAAQRELIIASASKKSQPQLYKAVRNKFKNWKISATILDKIENSREVLTKFPIHAHTAGIVTEIVINQGAHVMDGMPILKISNLTTVWAEFDVYESQVAHIKQGQKITIGIDAYKNRKFEAEISFVDPILNAQTRTVTIRSVLKNNDGLLKPGMFIKGKVHNTATMKNLNLTIPTTAVLWTGERSLVYVKTRPEETVFEMREVIVGDRVGAMYHILSGLRVGDEIVTNGTFTVDAAAQLQGKKSMMQLSGRSDKKNADKSSKNNEISTSNGLGTQFQQEFQTILKSYIIVKDAFVASNADLVIASAEAIVEKMKKVPLEDATEIEVSLLQESISLFNKIARASNLKEQRSHFVHLNEKFVAIAEQMVLPQEPWYVQKCPMANASEGAIWLSTEKTIENPYYGKKMLKCGSVINTID